MRKLLILACVGVVVSQPALAKKRVYLERCGGTELNYRTARAACKSGRYPGDEVVACRKGEIKDRRTCNSDGAKRGVYVGSCSGRATGYSRMKKACQSGNHFGEFLVRCVKGKQKDRMQCEAASGSDARTSIFVDRCGNGSPVGGRNVLKACKSNPGQILVKCRRKGNAWKELKARHCSVGSRRDRFKFKDCSPTERSTLVADYAVAESRVDGLLRTYPSMVASASMSQGLRRKMERVKHKLEKIQKAMDRPRKYVCRASRSLCASSNAHTLFAGRNVKMCDNYFAKSSQLERASIIVHEISHHKTQTNDKGTEHGGCRTTVRASASSNFQRQAEYYEHIVECGWYIPR